MKPVSLIIGAVLVLMLATVFPALAQSGQAQTAAATLQQQEQLELKWAAYMTKVAHMKRLKKHRLALEAEYNALVEEMEQLYHLRPVEAKAQKAPFVVGSVQVNSKEKTLR